MSVVFNEAGRGFVWCIPPGLGNEGGVIDVIPDSLKHAIATGIGLLIALVGFEWAGLVRAAPGTFIALGNLHHPATGSSTSLLRFGPISWR